jgi:hypothetical protein
MSRSYRRAGLGLAALALVALSSAAHAENINEFNLPGVGQLSHQASADMLNGISYVFRALAAAEQGDPRAAAGMRSEALAALKKARENFQRVRNEMKSQDINFEKAPKTIGSASMEAVFRRRGYDLPKNTTALADVALKELDRYTAAIEALSFEGGGKARPAILRANDDLHRLTELGVAISTLSDAAA